MSKHQKIRIVVVEDYLPLLNSLREEIDLCPGMKCVGIFASCEDMLKAVEIQRKVRPDVILMDLGLPMMDGINCTREIKRRWPRIKVLIFSADETREQIVAALTAGADGYLDKSVPRQKVAAAIERVHEGDPALSAKALRETIGFFHVRPELIQRLSPQEKRVLDEWQGGARLKEIAATVGVSPHTVREYIRRICQKTGVDRMAAAAFMRKQIV